MYILSYLYFVLGDDGGKLPGAIHWRAGFYWIGDVVLVARQIAVCFLYVWRV